MDAESFGARDPRLIVHCPDNDGQIATGSFLDEFGARNEAMRQQFVSAAFRCGF